MSPLAIEFMPCILSENAIKAGVEWQEPFNSMWKFFFSQHDSDGIILQENGNNFPNLISLVQLIAPFQSSHKTRAEVFFFTCDTAKVRFRVISLPFTVCINHCGISVIRKFTCKEAFKRHFRSHVAIEKCLKHVPVIHSLILTFILLLQPIHQLSFITLCDKEYRDW